MTNIDPSRGLVLPPSGDESRTTAGTPAAAQTPPLVDGRTPAAVPPAPIARQALDQENTPASASSSPFRRQVTLVPPQAAGLAARLTEADSSSDAREQAGPEALSRAIASPSQPAPRAPYRDFVEWLRQRASAAPDRIDPRRTRAAIHELIRPFGSLDVQREDETQHEDQVEFLEAVLESSLPDFASEREILQAFLLEGNESFSAEDMLAVCQFSSHPENLRDMFRTALAGPYRGYTFLERCFFAYHRVTPDEVVQAQDDALLEDLDITPDDWARLSRLFENGRDLAACMRSIQPAEDDSSEDYASNEPGDAESQEELSDAASIGEDGGIAQVSASEAESAENDLVEAEVDDAVSESELNSSDDAEELDSGAEADDEELLGGT
jgi:hypothetical protein